MVMNDTLASALSKINNAEKVARDKVEIQPFSTIIKRILTIANERGYLGKFEEIKTPQGGYLVINLLSKINGCGAIKPRYSVSLNDYEKFEKRYLPSKGFGVLFVSTTKGIMTQEEAQKQKLGGVLLAYMY